MDTGLILCMIWGGVCGFLSVKTKWGFWQLVPVCFGGSLLITFFCKAIGL